MGVLVNAIKDIGQSTKLYEVSNHQSTNDMVKNVYRGVETSWSSRLKTWPVVNELKRVEQGIA